MAKKSTKRTGKKKKIRKEGAGKKGPEDGGSWAEEVTARVRRYRRFSTRFRCESMGR